MSKRGFSLFFLFLLLGTDLFPVVSLAHYQIEPFIYESEYRGPKEGNQESILKDYIDGNVQGDSFHGQAANRAKEEEPPSFGMMNVYTQLFWNFLIDTFPNTVSHLYARINGFRVEQVKTKEYKIHGSTPKEIPPYLAQIMQKTAKLQLTVGSSQVTLGEQINRWLYQLHYNMMMRGRYGLAKSEYRMIGLKDRGYFEMTQSYSKGTKYSLSFKDAIKREAKTAFMESFVPWSQQARSTQWVKMTGYVGLGATFFFTFLDYGWGENAKHGWGSTEFVAALITDAAFGGLISVLGSVVGSAFSMLIVTTFPISLNLVAVGVIILGCTFAIGYLFETNSYLKRMKDFVHRNINSIIETTVNSIKRVFNKTVETIFSFFG